MKFIVNDNEYTKFTSYTIADDYNAIAGTFQINGVGADSEDMLYKYCELRDDVTDEIILAGKIHSINTSEEPSPTEPNVVGYGEAGILEDVMASLDSFPLERSNLNLEDIIRAYWGEYGILYAVHESDLNTSLEPLEKISISKTGNIKQEINKLIIQRGMFLSHLPNGSPLLVGKPLEAANIYDYEKYINNFAKNISGRGIHSKINVYLQADTENDGKIYTIENDYVTENRERNVIMKDGTIADMEGFAKKLRAQEMLNVTASFNCTKFIPVGNIIPIYGVDWFITKFNITGDSDGEVIKYDAVLASVYEV